MVIFFFYQVITLGTYIIFDTSCKSKVNSAIYIGLILFDIR